MLADLPNAPDKVFAKGAKAFNFPADDPLAAEARKLYIDIYTDCNQHSQNPNPAFADAVRASVQKHIAIIVEPTINGPHGFNFWWTAGKK